MNFLQTDSFAGDDGKKKTKISDDESADFGSTEVVNKLKVEFGMNSQTDNSSQIGEQLAPPSKNVRASSSECCNSQSVTTQFDTLPSLDQDNTPVSPSDKTSSASLPHPSVPLFSWHLVIIFILFGIFCALLFRRLANSVV